MDFAQDRYQRMLFRRCGRSGLQLPALSLGCWHNFTDEALSRSMLRTAFDGGITHFDLANNYGPPPGTAEAIVGRILKSDFAAHRDELIISTKAGYDMWPGPYGNFGSRKYLMASIDQSLRRLKLEYVDIFYHHRPDPQTPLEESLGALESIVRQGKALYAGVSNYGPALTAEAQQFMRSWHCPLIVHQPKYSMLERTIERELLQVTERQGMGVIVFCPLAQGLLTDKYLKGVPEHSRAANPTGYLKADQIKPALLQKISALNDLAAKRGQSLARMALKWTLRDPRVTSALIGASRPEQIVENLSILNDPEFDAEELKTIDRILQQ